MFANMDPILEISVPCHKDRIFHSLHELQQQGVLCDVSLKAWDGYVQVHQVVLMANDCSYINDRFKLRFKTGNQDSDIDCSNYCLEIVEAVVILLYTGKICIEEKYAEDLLLLFDELNLESACHVLRKEIDLRCGNSIDHDQTSVCSDSDTSNISLDHHLSNESESSRLHIEDVPTEDLDNALNKNQKVKDCRNSLINVSSNSEDSLVFVEDLNLDRKEVENLNRQEVDVKTNENSVATNNRTINVKQETDGNEKYMFLMNEDCYGYHDKESENNNENQNIEHEHKLYKDETRKLEDCNVSSTYISQLISELNHVNDTSKTTKSVEMPTKLRSTQFVKKQQTSIAKSKRKFPNSSSKSLGDRAEIIDKKQEHKKHISKHSTKRNIKLVSSKKDGNLKKRKTNCDVKDVSLISNDSHESVRWRHCVKCPESEFSTFKEYVKHLKEVHRPYPCQACDWVGYKKYLHAAHMYGQHKIVAYPEQYPLVHCDEEGCNYKCISLFLKEHKRRHQHRKDTLVCDVCGMTFKSQTGLRYHSFSHEEEDMRHNCKICDKVFGWKNQLMNHVAIEHSTERLCHLCPFKTKTKISFDIHMFKIHREPVPDNMTVYSCSDCDFYTLEKRRLDDHRLIHSDERSFVCPECSKAFKKKWDLKRHIECHRGRERNFKCDLCDYKGVRQGDISKHHLSRHSNVKPFSCELCSYSCKLKGNLKKHMENKHKLVSTNRPLQTENI